MVFVETKNVDSYVNKVVKDLGNDQSFVVSAKGSSGWSVMMWNDMAKVIFFGNHTLNTRGGRSDTHSSSDRIFRIFG